MAALSGTLPPDNMNGWSLALIGNASDGHCGLKATSPRGVFDKETRRKPLAFAADA